MPNLPPELPEGSYYPGASWFAALLTYLRSCRVTVARDSGLYLKSGPSGTAIGLARTGGNKLVITTSVIPARSGNTLGKGTATIRRLSVTSAGVATWTTIPGNVTVYNDDPSDSIASGIRCQAKDVEGILIADVEPCTGGTT